MRRRGEADAGEPPELADLVRRLGLRPRRPVPDGLVEHLVHVQSHSVEGRRRSHPERRWRPRLSWVGVALPAVAAAALPLAVAQPERPAPTHSPTPCTLHLVDHAAQER